MEDNCMTPSRECVARETPCFFYYLPPELFEHVIDELKYDTPSLRCCSLVCKAWHPRSSFYLFASFRISCFPLSASLLDFHALVSSGSTRVPWHIRCLEVDVLPHNIKLVATLLQHLPRLESLALYGIQGLFGASDDIARPALACNGRALKQLRAVWLPVDHISCFLALFTAVDVLEVCFAESTRPRGFSSAPSCVRHLLVKSETDEALGDIGHLVEPCTLESIALDLDGVYYHEVAPERLHALLCLAGRHIKHLELALPPGGWTDPPHNVNALATCANLESVTLTTPQVAQFSTRLWLESATLLASLPPQTRHVRFETGCRGLGTGDSALRDFVHGLDWSVLARAMAHCRGLEKLEVVVLGFGRSPVLLAGQTQIRDVVLAKFPVWIKDVVVFV